jgi:hypothetical protein
MKTMQHVKWNIRYDVIDAAEAGRMLPDVAAETINELHRRLAEAEFLLSCHGDGMTMPDELRYDYPTNEYREI